MTEIGDFETDGWMRLPFRFSQDELDQLSDLGPHAGRGVRLTEMKVVADALPIAFINQVKALGFNPTPNRAIGFVKSSADNWSLPWHQDRIIAMAEKISSPRYSNWSRKSGIWHCEPTVDILRDLAFAYIAFDDMRGGKGGLELAAGTHMYGKIEQHLVEKSVAASKVVNPKMLPGDVLFISALTLHRSNIWSGNAQRRALRIDFFKLMKSMTLP